MLQSCYNQDQIVLISNHQRCRETNGEDNKSQEQTTSKTTAAHGSHSYVAMQRAAMGGGRGDSGNRVITPAKAVLAKNQPKNALA